MISLLKTTIKLLLIALVFPVVLVAQNNNQAQLANQFFKAGAFQKASELYIGLYKTHKIEEAEKLVKKYRKKHTKNTSVLVDYAHIYTLKGEHKKADKKFKELLNQLKENDQLVSVTANRLYKFEHFEYAIEAYKIGLLNPAKSTYRFQLARIYGQQGNIELMYENYLELITSNKQYLQSVKNTLNRTVSNDSESENNILLKNILLRKVQETNDENLADLLIWLFIQEKNFTAAFDQEKAMDQKLKPSKLQNLVIHTSFLKAQNLTIT